MGAHSAGFESRSYLAPGGIAQLVEHRRCIPKVAGSNPAISTSGTVESVSHFVRAPEDSGSKACIPERRSSRGA